MRWTVLVPLKALPAAKSRLRSGSGTDHAVLVRAMRADTLAAARSASSVARVVVVLDRPSDEYELAFVQTVPGLNAGLAEGSSWAGRRWPADGIAALVGDLPALAAAELDSALGQAAAHARSFVPDAAGTGTTLLAVAPGLGLRPSFGQGSAERHRASAVALDAGPGLRHDVDTLSDLHAAAALGVGPQTRAVYAQSA